MTECGAPDEDLLGSERALEVVRSSLGGRSADIGEALYRAVRDFEEGVAQRDDVTTVVVRYLR